MPDPERLKRDTLLLASQVWTVGCGVMKRRVYISLPEVGGVCNVLERETVLGVYCLRVAGKRKGDVFRRRQAEQEWGWKYEQSWQGWRKETVTAGAPLCSLTTQHWTLETSGKSVMRSSWWRVPVPVYPEAVVLYPEPSWLQCVKILFPPYWE